MGGTTAGNMPCTPATADSTENGQPVRQRVIKRRIVEFCCGPNSLIGQMAPPDCEVIRLTIDDDMTSTAGLATALYAVSDPDIPTLLFGALPCTGGSPYVNLNWWLGAKTRRKIRSHWAIFDKLWTNFHIVAEACLRQGGQVAIEWPRSCMYWRRRKVKTALRRWRCQAHALDGCMYGLTSQAARTLGIPLRKPWTIATTCPTFHRLRRTCDGTHAHAPTQGRDTRLTEGYTPELARSIHDCWRAHCATLSV